MTVVADLHVHTTNSDGTLEPADVPGIARRAGLDAVAITDHERFPGDLDAPVVERDGVIVVRGIELRVALGNGAAPDGNERPAGQALEHVDLLGYAVEDTAALVEEVDRLQRDRVDRAAAIVERVEARLDVELDLEPGPGVGRPHIARAIERSDAPYDYAGAFEHVIGDDGPCYVARDVPSFERGRDLLSSACSLVALAHPLRYADPVAALSLCADLDAVERWYPYDEPVDLASVDRAIEEYGLLPTGGSDAHDEELGLAGLDEEGWERVRSRLPRP